MPDTRPLEIDSDLLLSLRTNLPRAGHLAMQRRTALFGDRTLLRPTPRVDTPTGPALLRRDQLLTCAAWPEPAAWQAGDRVMLPVEPDIEHDARRYVAWLLELAAHEAAHPRPDNPLLGPCSVAPFCPNPAGTHRLWLIAAARIALPGSIRVEARHDLIGIRLAQVALGFGADTLAGPVEADRHLPVAGVTRPNEASITGLRNLIEQAGLDCALHEDAVPRALETAHHTMPFAIIVPDREDPS